MIRGFYTASVGMAAQMNRQLAIANNLANVETPGYKQDAPVLESFPNLLVSRLQAGTPGVSLAALHPVEPVGPVGLGNSVDEMAIDLGQGPLRETGQALDLALDGAGYFSVETAEGVRFTRDGRLKTDAEGRLLTRDDLPVAGVDGPIVLPPGEVTVLGDGTVMAAGERRGRLKIVDFPPGTRLEKAGNGLFTSAAAEGEVQPLASTASVRQGFLEMSNVDVSLQMTEMLSVARAYEAAQRALALTDQSLQLATTEVGRLT